MKSLHCIGNRLVEGNIHRVHPAIMQLCVMLSIMQFYWPIRIPRCQTIMSPSKITSRVGFKYNILRTPSSLFRLGPMNSHLLVCNILFSELAHLLFPIFCHCFCHCHFLCHFLCHFFVTIFCHLPFAISFAIGHFLCHSPLFLPHKLNYTFSRL